MKREELLAQRDNPTTCYRNARGEGFIDLFKEERIEEQLKALKEEEKTQLNITKPEPKEHNITDNEKSSTSEQNTEDEGRDESDYSNRLRDH